MTTVEFITELFWRIDDAMRDLPKHPHASRHPREGVTLAFMLASKGGGNRPFYRGRARAWHPSCPQLPERTRVFRLFITHRQWTERFLADPTLCGVIDP